MFIIRSSVVYIVYIIIMHFAISLAVVIHYISKQILSDASLNMIYKVDM